MVTKRKPEFPPARNVAPLRVPGDVIAEQKRAYRAALNGKIRIEDLPRLIFALKEIRAGIEAEMERTAAGVVIDQVGPPPIVIRAVEPGMMVGPDGVVVDGETARVLWGKLRELRAAVPALGVRPALKIIEGDEVINPRAVESEPPDPDAA